MSMTYPYCNLIDDLQQVFKDLESFNNYNIIEDFELFAGNVYIKYHIGYIGSVLEDDIVLDYNVLVDAPGSWYYDETNDTLKVWCSDDANPSTHVIKIANESWANLKTRMRDIACEQLESMLDPRYPRPLPMAVSPYRTSKYDADIVVCCAYLTVANIIEHVDVDNYLIQKFREKVFNLAEESGILWEYKAVHRAFSFESTKDDFKGNITPNVIDSSSTGRVWVTGNGTTNREKIIIQFTTGGAPETAKFKWSDDNETTWNENQETYYQYTQLYDKLYLKFDGSFVIGDKWTITTEGYIDKATSNKQISSISFERF